jgi:hypothetical protein
MKPLRYSTSDIRAWADFSGDFNPVHFDLSAAARLGLHQVPVHGMRVMLDVKSELSRLPFPAVGEQCEPLLFKATLRAPVLCNGEYQLHVDRNKGRHGFSLIDKQDGKTCIAGYLRPATPKETGDCNRTPMQVVAASTATQDNRDLIYEITHFVALSDDAPPTWLLLDALLFRHLLLHEGELFGDMARTLGIDGVQSASALMRRATVLQTHHETLISPLAQQLTLETLVDEIGANGLHYEVHRPVTAGDAATGLAINGSLVARAGDAVLTRTSIGLLALPTPFSPQRQESNDGRHHHRP